MQLQTKIAIGLGIVVVGLGAYFFIGSSRPEPIALDEPARKVEPTETKTGDRASRTSPAPSADARSPAPVRRPTVPVESRPLPQREESPAPAEGERAPVGAARLAGTPAGGSEDLTAAVPPMRLPPQQTPSAQPVAGPVGGRSAESAMPSVPGTAAPQTPTAPVREHVVKAGDTLSSLAVEYYGSQRHTQFLISANPQVANPNFLRIGTKLKVPPLTASGQGMLATGTVPAERTGQPPGANQYVIKEGDTFYSIAQTKLGDARRWPQLYEINKDLFPEGPETIRPGVVIELSESR